jgi:hypothetical protein
MAGSCKQGNEPLGCVKAEQLLASPEGPCSMELFCTDRKSYFRGSENCF